MNGELIPAVAAATGGTALIGVIALHERRRDEAMRAGRVRLALRFPAGLEPLRAVAGLDGLCGLPHGDELVAEVVASEGAIGHGLLVPASSRSAVITALTGAIPSLRITDDEVVPRGSVVCALKLFIPTPAVLADGHAVEVSCSLLTGLGGLRAGEQVAIRWALRPGVPRSWQPAAEPDQRQREIERVWRHKTALPGLRVAGLVLVCAGTIKRARELAGQIESVLRSRRRTAGEIRITRERGSRSLGSLPKTTRTSGWLSGAEVVPLLAWPLGAEVPAGVEVGTSRQLPVPRHVPREGRELFIGRDSFGDRPVAISAQGSLHHVLAVAPSGGGKTVLLGRGMLSDVEHGYGGVWIAPKGELELILDRIKPEYADRIVVLDAGDSSRPTPGLAVLGNGDPDLASEVLTGALRSAFPPEAWGVRTDFYLRTAIRTLSEMPGATLVDVGRLFFDDRFRRTAISRLRDPFLIASWQGYEALSASAQAEQVQAPMNRVMALLSRSRLRAVLAAPNPKLDVARLLAERKFLVANLAPGALGESGASVLGAVLMHLVWSAIEARVNLPAERRHPVFLYLDELATLTHGTPFSFELLAERARGLGAGLTVALQTLGRIPEPTRGALLGNAATFITWRANAKEAPHIARQLPGLGEADVMGLQRFEVAARLGTGIGSSVVTVTGRTQPLPPPTGMAEAIRDASAKRYGNPPSTATQTKPTVVEGDNPPPGRARRQA